MVHVAHKREVNGAVAGNVHVFHRTKQLSDSDAVHFSIRIENLAHIGRAYGDEGARIALAGVCRLLTDLCRGDGIVVPEANGEIDLVIWNREVLGGAALPDVCRAWLTEFCRLVPLLRFDTPLGPLHLAISGRWEIPDAAMADDRSGNDRSGVCSLGFRGAWPDGRPDGGERYRHDMGLVTDLLSGVMSGASDDLGRPEFALAWQPVCAASDSDIVLYREALVRLLDDDGKLHSPGEAFHALERLGFARVVDHHVVSLVIDELEEAPDVTLAANISAQSVCDDCWWDQIRARLVARPDVARRLILEITEAAAMPDISAAVRFVTGMRRLGCRIALDDFGTGYASIRQLIAFSPDFVKIDRFFVRRAAMRDADRDLLAHLIGVGQSLGGVLIVEGVETAEQADAALAAGGHWQQGYHWGRPALHRSWRKTPGTLCRNSTASISIRPDSPISQGAFHGR